MRAILIDDEKPARDRLRRKLLAYAEIEIVAEAKNGQEALELCAAMRPDVIFLDIEMPELDGFEVAKTLTPPFPAIVFVTAYDSFALKAFEACAVDYLVKPVSEERLHKTVERLKQRPWEAAESLRALFEKVESEKACVRAAIKVGTKYVVINPSEISAISARDHYASIFCKGQEYLCEESLDRMVERFRNPNLVRVHRSHVINLQYLSELKHEGDRKYLAILSDANQTQVPVSRERLAQLKRYLGLNPSES